MECYICLDLFSKDITELFCCRRWICSLCSKESPKCRECSEVAHIEVNLEQLQQEIIRVQEVAEEQLDFYSQYGCVGDRLVEQTVDQTGERTLTPEAHAAYQADSKAIILYLELLTELEERLLHVKDPSKTVLIPEGVFIRSKDFNRGHLVNSKNILQADTVEQRDFFESHKIYYHWNGKIPSSNSQYIRGFSAFDTAIDDISSLENLPLVMLNLAWRTRVKDFSVLTSLTNLTHLDLSETRFTDLSVLADLALIELSLAWSKVSDLSPLVHCVMTQTLTQLDLYETAVDDITSLASMTKLIWLDLRHTRVKDITALTGTKLKSLMIGFTQVTDISALSGLALLELDLRHLEITDLSSLTDMSLRKLQLDNTPVEDITMLKDMPLVYLSLTNTGIRDYSAVAGMVALELYK